MNVVKTAAVTAQSSNIYMKTIKIINKNTIKLDGVKVKGYEIGNIPDECNSWFNYKGLTYISE